MRWQSDALRKLKFLIVNNWKQPYLEWFYELTKRKLSSGVGYVVGWKANLIGGNNRRMDIRTIVKGNG